MDIQLVDVKGDLLRKLPRADRIANEHIQKALNDASALVWQRSIERAPKSIGQLAKSIRRELHPTHAKIYPTVKYGYFVHQGTQPHAIPAMEAQPGGSLYRWAKKKGMNPWAVRAAIMRKGTKAQPWMGEIAENGMAEVEKVFAQALTALAKDLI